MGSTPDPRGICRFISLNVRKARRVAVCLYKWLSGCLMETFFLSLQTLRNECLEGSSKLLRCWMIGGVLKRLQTMSVSGTGVTYVSTLLIFKRVCPRNLHNTIYDSKGWLYCFTPSVQRSGTLIRSNALFCLSFHPLWWFYKVFKLIPH